MTDVPEADALYAVEPSVFVAARNALVKQLKADKRKDEAAEVAALRKPSAAAWALNQVARSNGELIDAALAAGAALREATDAAVAGDASSLRATTLADRTATDAVVDAAVKLLGGRGAAQRQAMAATVRAAVLEPAVADLLRRGVLVEDQEEGGFGFGFGEDTGAEVIPFKPREKKAKAPRRSDEEKTAARREAEEAAAAEEAEREARRHQAALEAEADRLERRAARLAEVAEKAELTAREARADADEAAEAAAAARAAATPN